MVLQWRSGEERAPLVAVANLMRRTCANAQRGRDAPFGARTARLSCCPHAHPQAGEEQRQEKPLAAHKKVRAAPRQRPRGGRVRGGKPLNLRPAAPAEVWGRITELTALLRIAAGTAAVQALTLATPLPLLDIGFSLLPLFFF